eukprot:TRINITY_DN977_c0_g1_i1.p1 TRINITY_DN977_c0_g1~~TRINITY_DN977_c0_g1_i1.p1  ORF type:complete len:169 (+),score=26.13 TRINITY_DN977_c0_g1_i1:47-508(+)
MVIKLPAYGKPLLGRYNHFPVDLFRIQKAQLFASVNAWPRRSLAERHMTFLSRMASSSPAPQDVFIRPNGMSLRPVGSALSDFVTQEPPSVNIFRIPANTKLPSELVLLHEYAQSYSLQTSVACKPEELNARLTNFLREHARKMSKATSFKSL